MKNGDAQSTPPFSSECGRYALELVFESAGNQVGVAGELALEDFAGCVLLFDVAGFEEDVVVAEVDGEVLVPLVGEATADPITVGVRHHSDLMCVDGHGTLVEAETAAQSPFFRESIFAADGEAPGVVPMHFVGGIFPGEISAMELHRHVLEGTPVGPGDVSHQC